MKISIRTLIQITALVILAIFGISGGFLIGAFGQLSTSSRVTALIGFASALGTLSLAAATFYSLSITRREFEIKEKERERPLAVDEISNVLQPAIDALESNISRFKSDVYTFDWIYVNGVGGMGTRNPEPVISNNDITALYRLQTENPELFQKLRSHEEKVNEIVQLTNSIQEKLRDPVRDVLLAYLQDEEMAENKTDVVLSAMLKGIDHFGKQADLYDFWEDERKDLMDLLDEEAGNDLDRLSELENEYLEHCEGTLEEAKKRKMTLREEFGISTEEIDFEEEQEKRLIGT